MLSKSIFKVGILAASVLATSIASATIGFGQDLATFNLDSDYQGTFTYGGTTYGSGAGNTSVVNLNSLPYDSNGFYRTADNSIYRIYKQTHSAVVGNITRGDADRSFVRDVAGENPIQGTITKSDVLPNGANYNYKGVLFNHIESYTNALGETIDSDGWVDLDIAVDATGKATVAGEFGEYDGNRPSVSGGPFTLKGTFKESEITNLGDRLGVVGGEATAELTENATGAVTIFEDTKFDLSVHGSNAEEVAGAIYTDPDSLAPAAQQLQQVVSGLGFAGEKQ